MHKVNRILLKHVSDTSQLCPQYILYFLTLQYFSEICVNDSMHYKKWIGALEALMSISVLLLFIFI